MLKRGKPPHLCSSYRPITVSNVFCKLFELLTCEEIRSKCYVPSGQFGFQKGLGCGHALSALCAILLDADAARESLVLGSHDVHRAFDSLVHEYILYLAYKRGVIPTVIGAYRDL